eukprot:1136806-Pelagomonas_calceolata.AAC.1
MGCQLKELTIKNTCLSTIEHRSTLEPQSQELHMITNATMYSLQACAHPKSTGACLLLTVPNSCKHSTNRLNFQSEEHLLCCTTPAPL